jgi:hypothetical protein
MPRARSGSTFEPWCIFVYHCIFELKAGRSPFAEHRGPARGGHGQPRREYFSSGRRLMATGWQATGRTAALANLSRPFRPRICEQRLNCLKGTIERAPGHSSLCEAVSGSSGQRIAAAVPRADGSPKPARSPAARMKAQLDPGSVVQLEKRVTGSVNHPGRNPRLTGKCGNQPACSNEV